MICSDSLSQLIYSFCAFCRLGGQAFAGDHFHQVAETVELVKRRVNVRRDTNPLELVMHDRRRENAMFGEQVIADRSRIDTYDLDVCNGT